MSFESIKNGFKKWLVAGAFATVVGGAWVGIATPVTTPASAASCGSGSNFLAFPTWYRGLAESKDGGCHIKSPGDANGGIQGFIWTIVLNVLDIMLRAIGFLAVGFIIYGGFKYITSTGSSDGMAKAKSTIQNAIIGLIISIGSVGIVNVAANVVSGGNTSRGGVDNLPTASADQVLTGILTAVYTWAGIACVLVIVIAGYYYVFSQGNASNISRAKNAILAGVAGLIIILSAFVITQFVLGRV